MIAMQPHYSGRERLAVMQSSFDYYEGKPTNVDDVVIGSVEWCEHFLPPIKPDYYPEFLVEHMHREWGYTDKWPVGQRLFIKPADSYKRFTGFVTNGGYRGKKRGPYVWSQPVKFVQEWRYYVTHGSVVATGWYDGCDEDEPAPALPFILPDICVAIDFGRLPTGQLALVEVQHPYACGWYGDSKNHRDYVQWLIDGWDNMTKKVRNL